ncbi:MAG: hypothetical protein IH616_08795, partial [Gemmatimonadales bacterium]|nr:hypothetical protein [Gemmatimonadales bacterium]
MRRVLLVAAAVALTACDHTPPFTITDPDALGPAGESLPRRLTFNPGPDEAPAARADVVVYSTLPSGRIDRDRCLAYLPPDGGTLLATRCVGGDVPDGWQDALLRPAPSADGRMAVIREQSAVGAVAPGTRTLLITPFDRPDSVLFEKSVFFVLPSGDRVLDIRNLEWVGGVLRFVAGEDALVRDPITRVYDTLFTPLALGTLDPTVGAFEAIPGTEGALAHVDAPGGGVWFVSILDPSTLLSLPAGGAAVDTVGVFSLQVTALGLVDGLPVAIAAGRDTTVVEWLDPDTGSPAGRVVVPGEGHAIAGIPGTRRFVLDLERGGSRDLW